MSMKPVHPASEGENMLFSAMRKHTSELGRMDG